MIITADILRALGVPDARIIKYLGALNDTLAFYEINTPIRIAHFMAQVLHESANFRYVEEIASGKQYEGRKDLGNIYKGDGVKFKGRGVIQLTGRANYQAYSEYKKIDFVANPHLAAEVPYCIDSAGYFFKSRGILALCDQDNILAVSVKVNGRNRKTGLPNHFEERKAKLKLAKHFLGL